MSYAVRAALAIVTTVLVFASGCGGGGNNSASTATATETQAQGETQTETEGPPAETVCSKLTAGALAAASNRVAYLRSLLPQAEEAGFGLAPLIRLTIRAIRTNNVDAGAHYFDLLDRACERAGY